ncbi:MAG: NAD(P)H-hydrate dehydratase [Alcaligenaceae bacterium]|nr:NAD(P)H-hydrate dehydratase [Alcaligenaceae bacterium]
MARADQAAIAAGVPGVDLMAAAGQAVADAIEARWLPGAVLVLCGPGNNGGDGFVVARRLLAAGWQVRVALSGAPGDLQGDAAWHAQQWRNDVHALDIHLLDGVDLVVDALFGAGLSRDVDGPAADILREVARRGLPVCAVDVPSGLDGASGQVRGMAVQAALTVTFFRKKPAHLLLPGRQLCGEVVLADIGIPATVLQEIAAPTFENASALWSAQLPRPDAATHKYKRGHVLVNGGARMTGAARLAALGAARAGAGLVTIAAPPEAWAIYAAAMTSIMVEALPGSDLAPALADKRRNALVLGPGAGVAEQTRRNVLAAAATGRALVLDADALSVFADQPATLFSALRGPCVLTPHDGEFARLFSVAGDKLARARRAAQRSGTVVVLKGADTVVAEPGGRAAINANAPAWLATGGSGDVLAGMVAALLAQGMPVFEAACAAVWMHGEAGRLAGPGLISEDLPGLLPQVLRQFYAG